MIYIYKRSAVTNYSDNGSEMSEDRQTNRTAASSTAGAAAMGSRITLKLEKLAKSVGALKSGAFSEITDDIQELVEQINTPPLQKVTLMKTVDSLTEHMKVLVKDVSGIAGSVDELNHDNEGLVTKCASLEEGLLTSLVSLTRVSGLLCDRLTKAEADSAADELEMGIIETGGEGTEYTDRILSEAEGVNQKLTGYFAFQNTFDFEPSDFEAPVDSASRGVLSVAALEKHTRQYETSSGSSVSGVYEEKQLYLELKDEVHTAFARIILDINDVLDFPAGNNLKKIIENYVAAFGKEKERWEILCASVDGEVKEAIEERHDALKHLARCISIEIRHCEEAKSKLDKPNSSTLRELSKTLSSFVISPKDRDVVHLLHDMKDKIEAIQKRCGHGVSELPIGLSNLHYHLIEGNRLVADATQRLHKGKLDAFSRFLQSLIDRSGSLSYYAMLEAIRSAIESNLTGLPAANSASVPGTPKK